MHERIKVKDFIFNGLTVSHMVKSGVKAYALDRLNIMCIVSGLLGLDTVSNEEDFGIALRAKLDVGTTIGFELLQLRSMGDYLDTDNAFTIIVSLSVMEARALDSIMLSGSVQL